MTIDYKFDENDFLTYQLYVASKSDGIKKRRKRNQVVFPLLSVAFGLFFFLQDDVLLAIIFFTIGLLWFFLFPKWERRHYLNQIKRCIKENYKDRLGGMVTLEVNNEFILAKDNGSESKVLTTELEEITEIPTTIFIKLKSGPSFILPKGKLSNRDGVTTRLKELTNHLNIKYTTDDKWEWK